MRSIVLMLGLLCAGCAPAMDRITATDFEPTGAGTFKFKAPIAPQYPDNDVGEAARTQMLQGWLTNNGMCARGYEITSRQPVQRSVFVSDVFYQGRCKA